VDDVSFDVGAHETVGVVGGSGCGKSTPGTTILRLVVPAAGEIRLKGADIAALSEPQLRPVRKSVQMAFQDPYASLNPRLSVWPMLETPLKVHGITDAAERRRIISEIAEATCLGWRDCSDPGITGSAFGVFHDAARIAFLPGENFRPGADRMVRLNFATTQPILDEILDRMVAAVRRNER